MTRTLGDGCTEDDRSRGSVSAGWPGDDAHFLAAFMHVDATAVIDRGGVALLSLWTFTTSVSFSTDLSNGISASSPSLSTNDLQPTSAESDHV